MAWRLGDLVACGEIINTSRYSTHGWLKLRDQDQLVHLELTGNCDPDLLGRHIRFEARSNRRAKPEDIDVSNLAFHQIGPTGTMTATCKVKITDYLPDERSTRAKLGELPLMQWKRCLFLEWFSQNGHVVVELPDPIIEFDPEEEPSHATEEDLVSESERNADVDEGAASLGLALIQNDDDHDLGEQLINGKEAEAEDLRDEEDDPYNLMPPDLQRELDAQARETDRALRQDEGKDWVMREMELMDHLIETSDGVPLNQIFDFPLKVPHPDNLSEEKAEGALKALLAQLALYGIALGICKHFAPRGAYRLLLEKICKENLAFPELCHTQWVQYYSTSEYCEKCGAEMDREFDEDEHRRKENPPDDSSVEAND